MKMKTKKMRSVAYVLVLTFGLIFTFTACEKNPEVMELPPAESLKIDFSTFPEGVDAKKSVEITNNWFYSAANILVWNTVVSLNVALPIVAYAEAFNHDPIYLGDESWEWAYDVVSGGITYGVSLVGARIDNQTFSMEMNISGPLSSFTWFTGVVRYDHTEAVWTLRHTPAAPVDYLTVTYTRGLEPGVYTTKYEVIDPANDLYEGYVEYGYNAEADMDAHYTISTNDAAIYIEWNIETSAGRVMAESQYGDALWHCWDTQLYDIDCPAE